MNYYTLGKRFKEKFPDWKVSIQPPCISETRQSHYIYEVYAYALGEKNECSGYVDIDETNKKFILLR